jgi:hypothetical protein
MIYFKLIFMGYCDLKKKKVRILSWCLVLQAYILVKKNKVIKLDGVHDLDHEFSRLTLVDSMCRCLNIFLRKDIILKKN